jgi:hypothetical protein
MTSMSNLWDYINAINSNKQDLMTGTENDDLAEAGYIPFLTNRALSQFPDTLLYANEMNRHNHLDNKLQFEYLLNSVRPKKRFSKWAKREDNEGIQLVMQYYKCNIKRAQEYIQLLTSEQLDKIKQSLTIGGERV